MRILIYPDWRPIINGKRRWPPWRFATTPTSSDGGWLKRTGVDRVLRIHGKGRAAQAGDAPPSRRLFAGVHVMEPLMLRHVPTSGCSSILEAYVLWLERGATVAGYVFSGYWSDVGTPERYAQVRRDVEAGILTIPA